MEFKYGLMYDCRRTPGSDMTMTDVYDATIAQAELCDGLGFDHVWFTEHHFLADGYLPAFQPLAGAIAARTKRVRISTDIALLPLYNALRLAEELAVLDRISHGRIDFGIGMGYVPEEFKAFGVPLKNRVSMTEEGIEILRGAWSDGPFSFTGKRYTIDNVDVHPKPVQPGGPPLWIAAMSTAGAMRAARFGTHLLPQGKRAEVLDPWRAALEQNGVDPATKRVGIIRSFYVSDDRDREWPLIRDAERFRMSVYDKFMHDTPDDYGWREPGGIPQGSFMGTAEQCIEQIVGFAQEFGITNIASSGLPPGVDPAFMNENLHRMAEEVLPAVRAALGNV